MVHVPVLLDEVVTILDPKAGDGVLDLTVGAGGHSAALLARLGDSGLLVGVDQDTEILKLAEERLKDERTRLLHGNFGDLALLRSRLPRRCFDVVLADLGVSSLHLDHAQRGFSFRFEGPLDMRMDSTQGSSAEEVVRTASEGELARIFREFGEERYANRVARAVVRARSQRPLRTTTDLAEVIRAAVGGKPGDSGIDPATRCFQGLRIAVNQELHVLDRFLAHFDPLLAPGGRLGILSYHSLEDRRVKQAFREREKRGDYRVITKRPVRPTPEEVRNNPRSRSARLRALEKRL